MSDETTNDQTQHERQTPPQPPKREHPSTYVVQDRENERELRRLTIQDQMITNGMGGVLPEQPDPTIFQRVLDVGCGTGGWAMEAARNDPAMSVVGIDISQRMMEYARAQAAAQHLGDQVEFQVMDALRILEFPDAFFDLVNLRFGISFLRTWDWPKMLSELLRVTRPGGIIRVTDEEVIHLSNSPALTQFWELFQLSFYRAGHLFANTTSGLTDHLPRLLTQHGCQSVQAKAHALALPARTPEGQAYYDDVEHVVQTTRPFLQKWAGSAAREYDDLRQRILEEMQRPDFRATWNLLTVWGTKPGAPHPTTG
ncbi:MAG: methyltransferase domain-containing protein [Ktedonobacteraceae bacterium]|nr:methyltransferase domain-containing protein [Ktedonobacteraceae bacterium]